MLFAMYSPELIVGPTVFDVIQREEWNGLAAQGMTLTPFQRHDYQAAWWRHLGVGELISVAVRDSGQNLVGIGCFNRREDRLVFNATKEETDYLDLIARPEEAEAVWTAVVDCLLSERCPAWQVLDCYNIPAASPSRQVLPRLLQSRGFVFAETRAEVCPIIDLPGDFEDYLAQLDKKQRHEIRRKMRRAFGADAELEIIRDPAQLHAAVDDFLDLLQKSTAEKYDWLNPGRIALFHDVAEFALGERSLLLMFMVMNGERIAGLFNLCTDDRVWVYNSGIDTTRYGQFSLGVVLTAHAIELAIGKGCRYFDFLRGNEDYKYRFGAQDAEIFRLTATKAG